MNKCEQVSSDHHQMSLAGGVPGLMSSKAGAAARRRGRRSCTVRSNTSWVMVTWDLRGQSGGQT